MSINTFAITPTYNLALPFGADVTPTISLSAIVWATVTRATNLVGINRLTNSF
jgi:hypothetical protein